MTEHTSHETTTETGIETPAGPGSRTLRRVAAGGLAATLAVVGLGVGLGADLGAAGAEARTAAATAEIGSAVTSAETADRQHESATAEADDEYAEYAEYEQGYDDGWDDGFEAGLAEADGGFDGDWFDDEDGGSDDGPWLGEDGEDDGDWFDDQDAGSGHDDHDHDHDGYEDEEPLATFPVNGDRLDTDGVDAATIEQALAIWDRFADLVPADQREMVTGFELLPESYEGAHVYPDENDPTKWILGVGLGLGEDLDYVLIHEFGHLLTLQAEEVPPSDDTGTCSTYHTGEGCALKGSTFAEFMARFWPQDLRDQLEQDGPEAVYEENPDRFVTDYAATNPAEDLAEVFAVFVTTERPTGDTVADEKVRFLWNDADMVELRNQIRSAL